MQHNPLKWLTAIIVLIIITWASLLFAPKSNASKYTMRVEKGQGISAVSRNLANNNITYSRPVLLATAYVLGLHNRLHPGSYRLPARVSTWQILQRLKGGSPDTISIRIPEGARFAQMRNIINTTTNINHDTANWSDSKLLREIDPNAISNNPEGLFFPDSYEINADSSDIQVYRLAYQIMQRNLKAAWDERQSNLPYQNPYQLLIMASLIEKETANARDRSKVAAVFVNRLQKGMRLQTDPTVIYGMGSAYKGRIRKADLQRDTPYNTYTRNGLTPTPISLPSKAALEAAAHPATSNHLYFVSKMDGTGESQFSTTLNEHNAAVRKYILKK